MHDPAAERILVHLAPHYGESEGVGAVAVGPPAALSPRL